jgi:tetratricopeptide (TPR) repeat protein
VAGAGLWWRGRPARHLAEAERLLAAGAPAGAIGWLAVPEAAPATRDRALLLRARAALALGRPERAVAPLEGIDPDGPAGAEAAFWKGRVLFAARQHLKAIAWYARSLELRPDDGETLRWLAAAAYDLGDRQTVANALLRVVELEPGDVRAWRTLGLVFKEAAEYRRARRAYEATLRVDPGQPEARFELAEVLVAEGAYAGAGRQLEACRGRVPEADRLSLLAECSSALGAWDRHVALVEAGLAAAPDHPGLLAHRARIDLAGGRADRALERLDRALAADPYHAAWTYQRGLALHALGRDDEAGRDLARASALNRDLLEMTLLNDEAALRPADAEVRDRLGRLCLRLGKPELAASWFYAALACDPGHAGARRELAALRRPAMAPRPATALSPSTRG